MYLSPYIILFCITIYLGSKHSLYIASQNGHSSTVEVLIKAGADVNAFEVVSCFV